MPVDVQIPPVVLNLGSRFETEFLRFMQDLRPIVVKRWEEKILEVKAIDRGWYYGSIGFSEISGGQDTLSFIVDTGSNPDVTYSGIVELGRRDVNYPARYPAQKAVEALDSDITDRLDATINRIFA